jgi:hypothetical protein
MLINSNVLYLEKILFISLNVRPTPFPAIAKVKQMNNRLSLVFFSFVDRSGQNTEAVDDSCQTVVLFFLLVAHFIYSHQ